MKLTHDNYFTHENTYLTSSKIRDFLKSREYFYKKHKEHSIEKETTDAMVEGSMVDDFLTRGEEYFHQNYKVVSRRNKKNPPTGYTEVTQAMWENAINRAQKVARCGAYQEIAKHEKQVLLQYEIKSFKQFPGLAGILDFLHINKKRKEAIITDLKTSQTIDPIKYSYKAIDFGYDIQLANYGWLVHELFDIPYQNIKYQHIVVEKDVDKIHKVGTFIFDNDLIDVVRKELKHIVKTIDDCDDWTDGDVLWEEAFIITDKEKINQRMMGVLPN